MGSQELSSRAISLVSVAVAPAATSARTSVSASVLRKFLTVVSASNSLPHKHTRADRGSEIVIGDPPTVELYVSKYCWNSCSANHRDPQRGH